MMVIFISECEKKALPRTRKVLDAFADRIGSRSWRTVITQEGLMAVKKSLRKTATKNTAVSCHWLRSRNRSDLIWVVGNKNKFNQQGLVPVNYTQTNHFANDAANDWFYLPLIQALSAMAALLHDWGKANARFQDKLFKKVKGQSDPLRHEWVSCLLLKAFILQNPDTWLQRLAAGEIAADKLQDVNNLAALSADRLFKELPPTAQLLMWLILSHHRLPCLFGKELNDYSTKKPGKSLDSVLQEIKVDWGYQNDATAIRACLEFKHGLLLNSPAWIKPVKRWAQKLIALDAQITQVLADGSFRVILQYARLCLMLGDHYYSSLDKAKSGSWSGNSELSANTDGQGKAKQALDQHLVGVYAQAKQNARILPLLERLPEAENLTNLKKRSPAAFAWQDKAVRAIQQWRNHAKPERFGFFAVNMASTGQGKTFANAKLMQALSPTAATLRFSLALGLRTLTLQTGDEYRERIFQTQNTEDLAVLIGSSAVAALHADKVKDSAIPIEQGSESVEALLGNSEDLIADSALPTDGLATVLRTEKQRQLLYAPVLVCTIDHLMQATEAIRGGRYILPCMRLLSADLVIDEIDDFTGSDCIAIGRLIFLAGLFGRKVMLSSATIPPAMAEGYFHAYSEGWRLFSQTRTSSTAIGCAWIDEFACHIETIAVGQSDVADQSESARIERYKTLHNAFIDARVAKLAQQPALRKASLIDCADLITQQLGGVDTAELQQQWFQRIAAEVFGLHKNHHTVDPVTGMSVSVGVIRLANITPCVALTRYLLNHTDWPADLAVKTMAYHSQQVLLMRHAQERYLDSILKRKERAGETPQLFNDPVIRGHINQAQKLGQQHLALTVVATPVVEVGRDHDFDWAIIEPSSFRSIIQMAGRVQRHRQQAVTAPNIALLQYNWRAVKAGAQTGNGRKGYFVNPGFESASTNVSQQTGKTRYALCSQYDLNKLLDFSVLAEKLDATARIREKLDATARISIPGENFKLARLEHAVTRAWLATQEAVAGPEQLLGFTREHWYLTGLCQALNRFRAGSTTAAVYHYLTEDDELIFAAKDHKGKVLLDTQGDVLVMQAGTCDAGSYQIQVQEITEAERQALWYYRDYRQLLTEFAEQHNYAITTTALLVGELNIPFYNYQKNADTSKFIYLDQLGLFGLT